MNCLSMRAITGHRKPGSSTSVSGRRGTSMSPFYPAARSCRMLATIVRRSPLSHSCGRRDRQKKYPYNLLHDPIERLFPGSSQAAAGYASENLNSRDTSQPNAVRDFPPAGPNRISKVHCHGLGERLRDALSIDGTLIDRVQELPKRTPHLKPTIRGMARPCLGIIRWLQAFVAAL